MPAKRIRKRKKNSQNDEISNGSRLSNSKMRKRRKIEEEKERARLLCESIEALEKYKIPEQRFSLLRSSRNLSRNETAKEKRRMAIQFSKAGLDVSDCNISPRVNSWIEEDNDEQSSFCLTLIKEVHPSKIDSVHESIVSEPIEICATNADDAEFNNSENTEGSDSTGFTTTMITSSELHRKPFVVPVCRPPEVETERVDLPIVGMEQEIMEAVNSEGNSVVIVCGQTGCGKTTQVPQFLFEAGFGNNQCHARSGMIGVTQPRRVAVLSTAKRVAYELGLHLGKEVGFQVRYDKKIGQNCSIKFMTDGILLREVQTDILLKKYSVIILDEVHERSVNTDILVGMLSRVVKLRKKKFQELQGKDVPPENMIYPLTLILMSATIRIEDFVAQRKLFTETPPVVNVEGRQYEVVKHFSKRTEEVDYMGQAYKKVMFIHKKLPFGAILVFVTGQREVELLCRKLRRASKKMMVTENTGTENGVVSSSIDGISLDVIDESMTANGQSNQQQSGLLSLYDESNSDEDGNSYSSESDQNDSEDDDDSDEDLEENSLLSKEETLTSLKAVFEVLSGSKNTPHNAAEKNDKRSLLKMRVLPLYAMLPAREQLRVYEEVKEGERLVVVATNVAETSLTIPGIRYVVDTGREKVKNYNQTSGVESYDIQWISKASADQRAGRAGRTGPGHCYRLYSRVVYENIFPQFSSPEITKLPVDSVFLVLKSMGIEKVENFPFPTPPELPSLREAERCLKTLQALDSDGRLTPLGKSMAKYPMSPRHSRMLLTAIEILHNLKKKKNRVRPNLVIGYAVAASVALCHPSPFQMDDRKDDDDDSSKTHKQKNKPSRERFHNASSDALTVAYALQCFEQSPDHFKFCREHGLHLKIMEEMSKLRKQILRIMLQQELSTWTNGGVDDVEKEWGACADKFALSSREERVVLQCICCGWADKAARKVRVQKRRNVVEYEGCAVRERVFLHRSSSVFGTAPEFLVYSELRMTKFLCLHGVSVVRPQWLLTFAGNLYDFLREEGFKLACKG